MELTAEIAKSLANKYGISLNFVIKDNYLTHILSNLVKADYSNLILTGDTAINRIYLGEYARFSEDADFELRTKPSDADINKLISTIKDSWFEKTEKRRSKHLQQVDFAYTTTNNFKDRVRLDINMIPRFYAGTQTVKKELISVFTRESVYGITSYTLEELIARKIFAMANRTEGKDIYDFYHSIDQLDRTGLEEALDRLLAGKGLLRESLSKSVVEKLRSINARMVSSNTNPYIPIAYRPNNWEAIARSVADYIENLSKH